MRTVWVVLVLGGCAAVVTRPAPRPVDVILYQDTLTVEMTDGSLCVGKRPVGRADWSGVLTGCETPLTFSVKRSALRPRVVLREAEGGGVMVGGVSYDPV